MWFPRHHRPFPAVLLLVGFVLAVEVSPARGEGLRLRDVCRLKGQEVNTLQGLGLVVGLRGTGDADAKPTARALSRMMQLMGGQMSTDPRGQLMLEDVEDARNVALVFVSARIPPVGAQQGDRLDLVVNAISAKSLEGGYLMLTPLLGPRADNPTVYAVAEGPLRISENGSATTATVHQGAKMEANVMAPFHRDGKLTLIIDRDIADFDTSQRIEEAINSLPDFSFGGGSEGFSPGMAGSRSEPSARAIDQLHIEVQIPEVYRDNPIMFVSGMMAAPISLPSKSNRVVINEREGVVVIGEDVEIAPALITHQNLRIEAKGEAGLVPLDQMGRPGSNAKLKALADALNALDVPAADLIAIIKALKRKGDLYGEVIFQ
ncbi:flagellar basal body P-ring protein FlgI [Candidatus Laterigemmans baculatus]|uniref:flagellar basal body P-ring protein FlgI n=1 Tax=Candidatus Laterigemmans baculatus TaxID=2770505 RepID=UPI0013D9E33A|nr:flagellar basal body P-ring protein FlgI [Candidatus Laterigemmans baculatus]